MLRRLLFAMLLLIAMGALSGSQADTNPLYSIILEPGVSEFTMNGEDFHCETPTRIRIQFSIISPTRVKGMIVVLGETSEQAVKLNWLVDAHEILVLHEDPILAKFSEFDSGVTGHNEKLR